MIGASRKATVEQPTRGQHWQFLVHIALILTSFAILAYGKDLSLPFIGDDYVFLDHTINAAFRDLWSFRNTDFGWYRPISREVHFWVLLHVGGLSPLAFRLASVALWIVTLMLYAAFIRGASGSSAIAAIATLAVGGLALWGTPLLWISGSQDLWMSLFAMLSLLLFGQGRSLLALLALLGALLSKETAGIVPLILVAHETFIRRRSFHSAIRRTAPAFALVLVWTLVHPILIRRLAGALGPNTQELEHRPPGLVLVLRTVLSAFNLDLFARPRFLALAVVAGIVLSSAVLAVGAYRLARERHPNGNEVADRRGLIHFGLIWAALGWLPLLSPSIGWHAYYGCLGAMGAWLAVATFLIRRPASATIVIFALALLRGAHAATPSWDWGNAWYQRRAGIALAGIRAELLSTHPHLPHYSRVFFGRIPNNIGLVAGQSPAIRIWYRDSTLTAEFYSSYTPRRVDRPGHDFFFRFDSVRTLVEVMPGPEDIDSSRRSNPGWEDDHEKLAMLFLRAGDYGRAGDEFAKIASLAPRVDAALYAAVAYELAGDSQRAETHYRIVRARSSLPATEVSRLATELRASLPTAAITP